MTDNVKNNRTFGERENRKPGRLLRGCREKADRICVRLCHCWCSEDEGIDGILVTVGLCIIALLLCVVMKNSLSEFIKSIVESMTREASNILSGTRG